MRVGYVCELKAGDPRRERPSLYPIRLEHEIEVVDLFISTGRVCLLRDGRCGGGIDDGYSGCGVEGSECVQEAGLERRLLNDGQSGQACVGRGEVEREREICDFIRGITWRERFQVPAPLDELKNRCVIEEQRTDTRLGGIAACKGRDDERGHAAPEQRFTIDQIRINVVGSDNARRSDVIEEPAPFIAVDDEDGVLPFWACSQSGNNFAKEDLAFTQVRVWMVVVAEPVVKDCEPGVDK